MKKRTVEELEALLVKFTKRFLYELTDASFEVQESIKGHIQSYEVANKIEKEIEGGKFDDEELSKILIETNIFEHHCFSGVMIEVIEKYAHRELFKRTGIEYKDAFKVVSY